MKCGECYDNTFTNRVAMHALENTFVISATSYDLWSVSVLSRDAFLLPENKRFETRKYQNDINIP